MSELIKCDKCKKIINKNVNWFHLEIEEHTNADMFTNGSEEYDFDLCASCKNKFIKEMSE